ncbi:hypothetical protein Holit_01572 [Hollandina sp. SP2]
MTRWEERIAGIFAERFPRSAAAKSLACNGSAFRDENLRRGKNRAEDGGLSGKASDSRAFRLTAEQLFPDFEASPGEEKESFLEAVESLERRGLVLLRWVPRRKGEILAAMTFPDPEAFFAFMGKPSPAAAAAEARHIAAEEAGRLETGDSGSAAYRELFDFFTAAIKPLDAVRGIDAAAVRDLAKLIGESRPFLADRGTIGADWGINCGPGLTVRALSIALYGDSKRLEKTLSRFARLLSAAEDRGIPVPDFSFLDRSLPETMIGGKLRFYFFGENKPLENAAGVIIGLPLASIARIRKIGLLGEPGTAGSKGASCPKVLMIENKETFYVLAGTSLPYPPGGAPMGEGENPSWYDAVLYAGGHPNRAVRALVGVLAGSGFEFFHAGDLDIDGILILQELMAMAGKPVTPVRMDRKTFEQYRPYGRRLETSMLQRACLIHEAARNLPGIGELINLIEETGLGVEQEIIDYLPALTGGKVRRAFFLYSPGI